MAEAAFVAIRSIQACRQSLRRLGREHIDVYFLHWPDDTGVPLEETWGAMGELVDAGLVRAIGMSNYEIEDVERCHAERPVDCVQVGLNLIDYLGDRASIAKCVELGIPGNDLRAARQRDTQRQDARSGPRAVGRPVGRIGLLQALAESRHGRAQFRRRRRPATDRGKAGCDGSPRSRSRRVLHQPGVAAAIAGSRNGSHMRENAEAAGLDLSRTRSRRSSS